MSVAEATSGMRELFVLGQKVWIAPVRGSYTYTVIESEPGSPGPPPHRHRDCAEFFSPVDPGMELFVEGEWTPLPVGSAYVVPPGTLHTFRNVGDRVLRFVNIFDPSGFERFFLEMGIDASEPGARERSAAPEMIERFFAGAAGWGMDVAKP